MNPKFNGEYHVNPNEEKPKGYKSQAAKQAFKDILKDKDMKVTVGCGNYTIKMNVILTDLILNEDAD